MRPRDVVCKNAKYEKFVRSKPCLVCGNPESQLHHVEQARKNAAYTVPLCVDHHTFGPQAYHVLKHEGFEFEHKINLLWECFALLAEFIDTSQGKQVFKYIKWVKK